MWSAVKTEGKRTYYVNNQTNETTWEKPVELFTAQDHALVDTPWKEYETEEGRVYWYNDDTKESTWDFPIQLDNSSPQEEFEKVCVDAGLLDGSLQEAIPLLIKHDFYFKISLQDRIDLFKKLRSQYSGEVDRDLGARGEKASPQSSTSTKPLPIDTLAYRSQIWSEQQPPSEVLADPGILDELRDSVEKHHEAEVRQLKDEDDRCQYRAASARLEFLSKLQQLNITDKTAWLDVAGQLEREVIALTPFPGSTPVDLFFWFQASIPSQNDRMNKEELKRLKKEALDALSKHNKNVTHVTAAEFAELTGITSLEVYEDLKDGYYWLQRKRQRSREEQRRQTSISDQDAPNRKEVALEY